MRGTYGGIVLDTQIDVFVDTEAKVAGFREVAVAQFVFLNLQAAFEDFFSLGAADGNVNSDLFVTANTEGTDGVTGLGVDGGLTGQLFEHLGGTGETITRFTNANVEDKLLNVESLHGVGLGLLFGALVRN